MANEVSCRLTVLVREHEVDLGEGGGCLSFLYIKGWIINYFASTTAVGFHSSKLNEFFSSKE